MWDEKFEELVSSFLPFLPRGGKLTEDTNLRDFGLDSMGSVELMTALENSYDVRFIDDAVSLDTFANPAVLWNELSKLLVAASR